MLTKALEDRDEVLRHFGQDVKISVNVTGTTVVTPRYQQFCARLNASDPVAGKHLCIEITEQAALFFDDNTHDALKALRDIGFLLAIDDFSMGQTSLHYLRDSMFDIIKLDGSLTRSLLSSDNSLEIVSSICRLSSSLGMTVVAEYVETAQQRDTLRSIGCDLYQGYLYSPAVFPDSWKKTDAEPSAPAE